MDDPLIPFLTFFTPSPDMSLADIEGEIVRLNQRNRAIDSMLQGNLETDVVLEMLYEDDLDPYEWIELSLDNVEFLSNA